MVGQQCGSESLGDLKTRIQALQSKVRLRLLADESALIPFFEVKESEWYRLRSILETADTQISGAEQLSIAEQNSIAAVQNEWLDDRMAELGIPA